MENQYAIFPETTPVVYAKFWRRFWAALLDGIMVSVLQQIVFAVAGFESVNTYIKNHEPIPTGVWSLNLLFMVVSWLYFALMEAGPKRATIGKIALGLEVTNMTGGNLTFGQATGRYFGKFLSTIILLIGYLMNTWDPKGQTLHDKLANALVIRKNA